MPGVTEKVDKPQSEYSSVEIDPTTFEFKGNALATEIGIERFECQRESELNKIEKNTNKKLEPVSFSVREIAKETKQERARIRIWTKFHLDPTHAHSLYSYILLKGR